MARIEQWRGDQLEAVHTFSAVAVRDGETVLRWGPDTSTTWRSAAKPFQLAVCLELLGDPAHSDEELAVGAASHSAEPEHLRHVEAILERMRTTAQTAGEARCAPEAAADEARADAALAARRGLSSIVRPIFARSWALRRGRWWRNVRLQHV